MRAARCRALALGYPSRAGWRPRLRGPMQQRVHLAHEIGRVERLGDEGIGADALRPEAVARLRLGGQEEDANVGAGCIAFERTTDLVAVLLRQQDLEHDEVGVRVAR